MFLRRFGFLIAVALACLAAWGLPSSKPKTALGHYTYPELMMALAATALLLGASLVVFAPASRRRNRLFKVIAVSLSGLAALAAVEIFAALAPLKDNPFYDYNEGGFSEKDPVDPRIPFTRPPHVKWEGWSQGDVPEWIPDEPSERRRISFQTDSEGFRNSEEIAQADLVFIGDSYTEAGNVLEEETFVRRTAAKLNRSARNLGLYHYAPQPELLILEHYGLKCRPKAVVWQFSETNDLKDALQYAAAIAKWEARGRPHMERDLAPRRTSREQRSPTHILYTSLVDKPRWWLAGTVRDAAGVPREMRFGYWPTEHHFPLGHPSAPWGNEAHPAWPILAEAIRTANAYLKERDIALVILFLPMKLNVYAEHIELDDWSRAKMALTRVPEERSMATQLGLVCKEVHIPFVDPTRELTKAAAAGELVYLLNDTHLSPRGHEIVSDLIANVLKDVLKP